jgi:hypothetical protein
VGDGQDPVLVGEVEALPEDPDLPGHPVVETLGQQLGQLAGQLLGQLGRAVGVDQQADHHPVEAPGPPAIGCRHGRPSLCRTSPPAQLGPPTDHNTTLNGAGGLPQRRPRRTEPAPPPDITSVPAGIYGQTRRLDFPVGAAIFRSRSHGRHGSMGLHGSVWSFSWSFPLP